MRRKFVSPSYDRKRKLREEMKELVRIGIKLVDGEKEYARREKEFKEKLQAFFRKKKEKERRTKGKIEKRKKERKNDDRKGKNRKVFVWS